MHKSNSVLVIGGDVDTELTRVIAPLLAGQNFREMGGDRWIWLMADPDDDLTITSDGSADDTQTEEESVRDWLYFEQQVVGWDGLLSVDDAAAFLLQEGLAPGQSFLVWMRPHYSVDYYGEHDFELDFEIVLREEMSRSAALAARQAEVIGHVMMMLEEEAHR